MGSKDPRDGCNRPGAWSTRVGVNMDQRTDQKTCGKCRQALPSTEFAPSQVPLAGSWCRPCHKSYRRARRAVGIDKRTEPVATHCERCGNVITGRRRHARFCSRSCGENEWRRNNPERARAWHWMNTYGITDEQRRAMFDEQGRACAICRATEATQWHVDHCHSTGVVRGILCNTCNHALGMFHDSTEKLTAAIAYLQRAATN